MSVFGTVIKEIRKERKMTQKFLCQNICSQSVLSRIENNDEIPNVLVMQQLCDRLGVSLDSVMRNERVGVKHMNELFDTMAYYYRKRELRPLFDLLQTKDFQQYLHLETDMQRYYYYLGYCKFYLLNDGSDALRDLEQALEFTYHNSKKLVSNIEIQLLSLIAMVEFSFGNIAVAEKCFRKSLEYFYSLPIERTHVEFTTVFYNYGVLLYETGQFTEAEFQICQGISWARQNESIYYLEDLFLLKSNIYEKTKRLEEAKQYRKLAGEIVQIREIY
ncbi:MAG: helix-turn-helix domain-containing protein [Lactobacillales bacterium]|jgi:transcriptional regulator with XRE-family HTH domain|nr:helix-turn-helix domain-containing protein [Lactobacillales bacterium]